MTGGVRRVARPRVPRDGAGEGDDGSAVPYAPRRLLSHGERAADIGAVEIRRILVGGRRHRRHTGGPDHDVDPAGHLFGAVDQRGHGVLVRDVRPHRDHPSAAVASAWFVRRSRRRRGRHGPGVRRSGGRCHVTPRDPECSPARPRAPHRRGGRASKPHACINRDHPVRARLFTHWSVDLDSWVDAYGCEVDRGPIEFTYLSGAAETIPVVAPRVGSADRRRSGRRASAVRLVEPGHGQVVSRPWTVGRLDSRSPSRRGRSPSGPPEGRDRRCLRACAFSTRSTRWATAVRRYAG